MTAEKLLEKAGAQLLFDHPFWATILYQMQRGRVPVGPEVCPMAATDGKALFYNPEAIPSMPFDQIKTLLAHEAGHIAFRHHLRMEGRDPELCNIAADHVINLILKKDGFAPWDGWLCDQRFEGQTFEQVYQIIERERQQGGSGGGKQPPPPGQPKPQQQTGGGKGKPKPQPSPLGGQSKPGGQQPQPGGQPQPKAASSPGGLGQIIPCPKAEAGKQEEEWKMAVEQAATAAKAAGRLPGHLARLVEELREAKVDWRELLRTFVANQIPSGFTWSRPSRRTLSQGIYLPSQIKEGLGDIVFVLDNSGSCTSAIPPFCSEVKSVHEGLKPSKLTMLCHDTAVYNLGEFSPGDDIEFRMKGGGGTDFRPAFDYIDQMDPAPRCAVFLTDLYGPLPTHAPNYPVLFVCTSKQIAPWGETAKMEV